MAAAAAASWVMPVANPHREPSLITVQPNGGNSELFQIHIPDDRIVAGGSSDTTPTPSSLVWPDLGIPAGLELELFKVRNSEDVVIGLASRISVSGQVEPAAVEWALHLPARGALYFPMSANGGEFRSGELRAGTREFLDRSGRLEERYVPDPVVTGQGRIELRSSLIGKPSNHPEGEQP
ncbi:hypothetical protein [Woeseia oceani]|uniref:Uncharacterized protein n=1 Tax=Woeseia oceani TaxID=1548547 RepID=A0A193LCQ1_9GAMM|nr:hypothetical protein [Woeseia oceani]ANO50221.1 hypothetical protein BA177_02400 [Woeseia oceani]